MLDRAAPCEKTLLVGSPEALAAVAGSRLPPNTTRELPGVGLLLWLRPDQGLLIESGADAAARRGLADRAAGAGVTLLDAGARFVEFEVSGPDAADLLATGCSLDLRERAFAPGTCAQTRIEQVPVILHREACDRFGILVERPLARYLWQWLAQAATEFEPAGTPA